MRRLRAAGTDELPNGADVVVVGAGIVGAAVAARLSAAGASVCVLDASGPAAGSSSSGEGNILVSDKLPGIDLALALRGVARWREVAAEAGGVIEFEEKGGLVVAADGEQLAALTALAAAQRAAGARVRLLGTADLAEVEPMLAPGLAGGAFYDDDCQVQPMLAVAHHLAAARTASCRVVRRAEVIGMRTGRGERPRLRTGRGEVEATTVVNAAGPWSGELAARLGSHLPVTPRRGHILVTEPVPPITPHKVSEASYVDSIHSGAAEWSCSSVVEATASGTMLLGSSREFAGWSRTPDPQIVAAIATRAVRLFPVLAGVRLLRSYVGFRPATPDRLPVIGWDGEVPALLHATGHEGAGIGLCEVTAELVECLVAGRRPPLEIAELGPSRFRRSRRGDLEP